MSSQFVLRFGERELPLPPGELVLGRAEECEIAIDDALVSRRHARLVVGANEIEIEDLGSRNGVLVDGARIVGPTRITHGSVLGIGSLRFVVIDRGRSRERATRPGESMLRLATSRRAAPNAATFAGLSSVAVVFQARDALDDSDVNRLRDTTKRLMELLEPGVMTDPGLLPQALAVFARCAIEIARRTGEATSIDALFEVHRRLGRVIDRDAVHSLLPAVQDLGYRNIDALERYLRELRAGSRALTPDESATLRRIDALLRVIAA